MTAGSARRNGQPPKVCLEARRTVHRYVNNRKRVDPDDKESHAIRHVLICGHHRCSRVARRLAKIVPAIYSAAGREVVLSELAAS